jgi:hypothetical protein
MKAVDIAAVFAEAIELSAKVPGELREAAFERAVTLLTDQGAVPSYPRRASVRTDARSGAGRATDHDVGLLFNGMDSSAFAEVQSGAQVLDRALWILRIGREHLGLDTGISADDVSRVLTDKFRIKTSRDAVRKAFDRAPTLVDRVQVEGAAARYRIMAAGDRYLAEPAEESRGAKKLGATRRGTKR